MKIIRSIFLSFTVWVLAALFNAILSSTCLYFFMPDFQYWAGGIAVVFFLSLIFSVPGIIIFWIVILFNWDEDTLFRSLLKAGFIIAMASSLFLFTPIFKDFLKHPMILAPCILVATIGAIMLHHSTILSFFSKK